MGKMSGLEKRLRADLESQEKKIEMLARNVEDLETSLAAERDKLAWMKQWLDEGPEEGADTTAEPPSDTEIVCPECGRVTLKSKLSRSGPEDSLVYLCPVCETYLDVD